MSTTLRELDSQASRRSQAKSYRVDRAAAQGGSTVSLVPVAGTRLWIEKMKEMKMTYQYIEVPGGDHGSVLTSGAPDIFAFFAKHSKAKR